ncbi:hypothetical protein QBC47DRAFT_429788 [Echria macrotheca]|uniref:Uncharacterized protein n=1 Tax=Echria macrotheca TaxID=438768 RepID=A0AAJ0FAI0_9PEZI|nr:hypothetical protein QBC47DRAFT_429788 [Echria macrotheca]
MYPSVESLTQDQFKVAQRCQFVFRNREVVEALDFEVVPAIRATIPMTAEDLDVQLAIDGSLLGRGVQRSLVLGPRSQMGELWFCPWKRRGDDSAVGEDSVNEDHGTMDQHSHDAANETNHEAIDEDHPPNTQRLSSPPTEHFHVPPRRRRARRRRRNPDSDLDADPEFVPPKRHKLNDDYVSPKTRNASSEDSKHHSTSPNGDVRSTMAPNDEDVLLYEVIDLTGDD